MSAYFLNGMYKAQNRILYRWKELRMDEWIF